MSACAPVCLFAFGREQTRVSGQLHPTPLDVAIADDTEGGGSWMRPVRAIQPFSRPGMTSTRARHRATSANVAVTGTFQKTQR